MKSIKADFWRPLLENLVEFSVQLNYDLLAVTLFLRSSLLFTNSWVLKAKDYENKDLFRLLFKILKSEGHDMVIF